MHVLVAGICAVLLSCRPAFLLAELSFYPPVLFSPAGETATFFCDISTVNFSHSEYSLNWYREVINSNQSEKIAELNGNTQRFKRDKFQLIEHNSIVQMQIHKLTKNDSGLYYCGLIAFSFSNKVMESKKSKLTVTDPEEQSTTPDSDVTPEEDGMDFNVLLIVVLSVAGAVLFGLVTYMLFLIMRRPAGQQKPQSEKAPLEGKPPAVTVYTVDYGVLEFQQDQKTKALDESFPLDQTEYATIVFSEEKPVTPERGKKTKNKRTCQTQMQPC